MASHLSEEASWAGVVANRLRLVQNNCVDEAPAARQEFLAEEIELALKDVAPSKRKASLQALAELFPAWNVAPPEERAAPAEIIQDTPEVWLERLVQAAGDLSSADKQAFTQRLKQAGFALEQTTKVAGGPVEAPPEMLKALGLPAGQALDPERAIKLLSELTQLFLILDQTFWGVLVQLGLRGRARVELKGLSGKFLTGDGEVSTQQVRQALDQSRTLIVGLLMAMGSAGREYAKKHAEHFSPEMIGEQAPMIRGFKGIDAKCWERYQELYKDYANEQTIEKEIQDAIVRCFKEVTGGRYTS